MDDRVGSHCGWVRISLVFYFHLRIAGSEGIRFWGEMKLLSCRDPAHESSFPIFPAMRAEGKRFILLRQLLARVLESSQLFH